MNNVLKHLVYLLPVAHLCGATISEINSMRDSKFSDELILMAIKTDPRTVELEIKDMVKLKQEGWSENLIMGILKHNASLLASNDTTSKKSDQDIGVVYDIKNTSEKDPLGMKSIPVDVLTSADGSMLLVDGKEVSKLKNGSNKVHLPIGERSLKLIYNGKEIEKKMEIKADQFNEIKILFRETPSIHEKKAARTFYEMHKTAFSKWATWALNTPTDLVENGKKLGQRYFESNIVETLYRITTWDETLLGIRFAGIEEREYEQGTKNKSRERKTLFVVEIDEKLNVVNHIPQEDLSIYCSKWKSVQDVENIMAKTTKDIGKWNQEQALTMKHGNFYVFLKRELRKTTDELYLVPSAYDWEEPLYKLYSNNDPNDQKEFRIKPGEYKYVWVMGKIKVVGEVIVTDSEKTAIVLDIDQLGNKTKLYLFKKEIGVHDLSEQQIAPLHAQFGIKE